MPTARAKFANGVLERLDLDEGQAAMLPIDDRPASKRSGRAIRVAGAQKSAHDPEKLKRDTYASQVGERYNRTHSGRKLNCHDWTS